MIVLQRYVAAGESGAIDELHAAVEQMACGSSAAAVAHDMRCILDAILEKPSDRKLR